MKLFAVLPLAILPLQAAVDPALLSLVMPDATVVAGVRVDQAQNSPLGRYLISQMKLDAQREKLLASTGFDPLRDLQEIVLASTAGNRSVVLAKGVFQPGRISAAAGLLGAPTTTYKGIQLLGANGDSSVAFLDASTIAVGNTAAVRGTIDRQGSLYNGALAQSIRDASGTYDAWFAAATPSDLMSGRIPQGSQVPARMLQTIHQIAGGLRFGSTSVSVAADAVTGSPQDAQALADVLRFLAGMATLDANTAPLLQSLQFSAAGSSTHIALEIPEKDVEAFVDSQTAARPRRAGPRTR